MVPDLGYGFGDILSIFFQKLYYRRLFCMTQQFENIDNSGLCQIDKILINTSRFLLGFLGPMFEEVMSKNVFVSQVND